MGDGVLKNDYDDGDGDDHDDDDDDGDGDGGCDVLMMEVLVVLCFGTNMMQPGGIRYSLAEYDTAWRNMIQPCK